MTKEEAIEDLLRHYTGESTDMAIKALEQTEVLDKIRSEIEELNVLRFSSGERIYKDEVLEIIDKYKVESEGEGCR